MNGRFAAVSTVTWSMMHGCSYKSRRDFSVMRGKPAHQPFAIDDDSDDESAAAEAEMNIRHHQSRIS